MFFYEMEQNSILHIIVELKETGAWLYLFIDKHLKMLSLDLLLMALNITPAKRKYLQKSPK